MVMETATATGPMESMETVCQLVCADFLASEPEPLAAAHPHSADSLLAFDPLVREDLHVGDSVHRSPHPIPPIPPTPTPPTILLPTPRRNQFSDYNTTTLAPNPSYSIANLIERKLEKKTSTTNK